MDREFIAVNVAVMVIADAPTDADQATGALITDRLAGAGHHVATRVFVPDTEAAIAQQLGAWISDPGIDVVITAGESENVIAAVEPRITKRVPGFTDLVRMLAFQDIGPAAMLSNAEAALCDTTFVFVMPASDAAVAGSLEKLIVPQLDHRTKPKNLVMQMPRVKDAKRIPTPPVIPAIPPVKPEAVPATVITNEKTAAGYAANPRTPAAQKFIDPKSATFIEAKTTPDSKFIEAKTDRNEIKETLPPAFEHRTPASAKTPSTGTPSLDRKFLDVVTSPTAYPSVKPPERPPVPPPPPPTKPAPPSFESKTPPPGKVSPSAFLTKTPPAGTQIPKVEPSVFETKTPIPTGDTKLSFETKTPLPSGKAIPSIAKPLAKVAVQKVPVATEPGVQPAKPEPVKEVVRTQPLPTVAKPARPLAKHPESDSPTKVVDLSGLAAQNEAATKRVPLVGLPPVPPGADPDLDDDDLTDSSVLLPPTSPRDRIGVAKQADVDDDHEPVPEGSFAAALHAASRQMQAVEPPADVAAEIVSTKPVDVAPVNRAEVTASPRAEITAVTPPPTPPRAEVTAVGPPPAPPRANPPTPPPPARVSIPTPPPIPLRPKQPTPPPVKVVPPEVPRQVEAREAAIAAEAAKPAITTGTLGTIGELPGELPVGKISGSQFVYPTLKRNYTGIVVALAAMLLAAAAGFFVVLKLADKDRQTKPKQAKVVEPGPTKPVEGSDAPVPVKEPVLVADTISPAPSEIEIEPSAEVKKEPEQAPEPVKQPEPAAQPAPIKRPPPKAPPPRKQPDRVAVADPPSPIKAPPPKEPVVKEPVKEPPPKEPVAKEPAPQPTADGCDEVSCVLDKYERPCCERFRPAEKFKPAPTAGGIPEELDKTMIRSGVAGVKPVVIACGEKNAASGIVKIALAVNADGRVTDASVAESPNPALGECVANAMRRAKFAKTQNGGSFTYPFSF